MRPSADERADQAAELEDAGRVEPVDRLVEDQQLGVAQQAARDAEPLAHAERVAPDAVVGARREPDALERAGDAAVGAAVARGGVHVQVLAARQVGVEARLLDDRADAGERGGPLGRQVVAEQAHAAGGRLGEAEQQADEGGLAGAVGAEEAERGAARHRQVDRLQRRARPEALAEAVRSRWRVMRTCRRSYGRRGRPRLGRPDRSCGRRLIRSDERAPVG